MLKLGINVLMSISSEVSRTALTNNHMYAGLIDCLATFFFLLHINKYIKNCNFLRMATIIYGRMIIFIFIQICLF